jgi:hypothetical protein
VLEQLPNTCTAAQQTRACQLPAQLSAATGCHVLPAAAAVVEVVSQQGGQRTGTRFEPLQVGAIALLLHKLVAAGLPGAVAGSML